jgi:formylmethanofuran dehydrogenase subunit A
MLKIVNGKVFDPRNGCCGEIKNVFIRDGRIVDSLPEDAGCVTIDAAGCVVMPGGIEIHAHVAGTKVNSARSMCPEDHYDHVKKHTDVTRSGTGYTVPSSYYIGYEYSRMGYTTIFEAAVPPLEARHAHEELKDIPLVDAGIYTLMGNNHMAMKIMQDGDEKRRRDRLRDLVVWLLTSSKGFAMKAVNPGGIENWKWGKGAVDIDTPVPPFGITPRHIMMELAATAKELKLPHGLHLHANHLGRIGNVATTLETLKSLDGLPVHLTHLQFHSYGKTKNGGLCSAAREMADFFNTHPSMTFDMGQLVFGPATTMTADSPMEYFLHRLTGNKWINADVEMETGSGVVPMKYRSSLLVNAIQWCIGLELMLLLKNPWQAVMTTDHPNAGPFTAYPQIIKLLMDRDYRNEMISKIHPRTAQHTCLAELDREYTLEEIAIITRAAPARILGLNERGHLGEGACGDAAIYREQFDKGKMFSDAAYVVKDGNIVVKDGEPQQTCRGRRLFVEPEGSRILAPGLEKDFHDYYSVELGNFAVQDNYLSTPEVIPCTRTR